MPMGQFRTNILTFRVKYLKNFSELDARVIACNF